MIGRLETGAGIAGLVGYVAHDKPTPDNPQPTSAERVSHVESLGLPGANPDLMIRCMQGLTADQADIKRRAGVTTRGRKLKEPYGHLMLSCPAGQRLSTEEWRTAGRAALKAIGVSDGHYGLMAIHQDTDHDHCHLVFSRIDPTTGKAATLKNSRLALSKWALRWEQEHGGIVIQARQPGHRARPKKIRDVTGRLRAQTAEERREWHELLTRQRQDRTPKREARHARTALARAQARRHLELQQQLADRLDAAAPRRPRPPAVDVAARPERPREDLEHVTIENPRTRRAPAVAIATRPERPREDLEHVRIEDPAPPAGRAPAVAIAPRPERPREDLSRVRVEPVRVEDEPAAVSLPPRPRRQIHAPTPPRGETPRLKIPTPRRGGDQAGGSSTKARTTRPTRRR